MAESFLPLVPRAVAARADGPRLTVVAANLEQGVKDAAAQARALAAVDADVLLCVEHTSTTRAALTAAGVDERWPHQADDPDEGYFGSLVASRLPVTEARCLDIGGRPAQVADVSVDGVVVRLVPVHTQAPIWDHDVAVWHSTIASNAAVAASTPGPVVLAGDWNATGGHRAFRRALRRHDLVDASVVRGHRFYPTWPIDKPMYGFTAPPLLTLDHVVVRATTEVVSLERIALPGTDHRALRAELRFPRP